MYYRVDGFFPSNSKEVYQRDEELLFENLDLILEYQDLILQSPKYYGCIVFSAYMSIIFLQGGYIPLGILLSLWKDGTFLHVCPNCGTPVHLVGLGGSMLSGCHAAWGPCFKCHDMVVDKNTGKFQKMWHPLHERMGEYHKLLKDGFLYAEGTTSRLVPEEESGLIADGERVVYSPIQLPELIELLKERKRSDIAARGEL